MAVSSETGTVDKFTVPVEQEEKVSRIYDCLLSKSRNKSPYHHGFLELEGFEPSL